MAAGRRVSDGVSQKTCQATIHKNAPEEGWL